MKAICFQCRFVGVSAADVRCPHCGFPLIQNTTAVGLGAAELERALARRVAGSAYLPGITPGPVPGLLRAEQRRQQAEQAARERARLERRIARRRLAGRLAAAASAFLAGLFVTLGALSAL